MYSTDACHFCVLAKEYFKKIGVAFEDKNVGVDRVAAQEMIMRSGQIGVPVIDMNGQIVIGFRPDLFEKYSNA